MRAAFIAGLLSFAGIPVYAQELYVVPDGVETRWASPENPGGERGKAASANGGRKGSASWALDAGGHRTLADVKSGSGMVHRIWMTISNRSPAVLRGLRIDMYWDGAKTPAVSAPLGDFFGIGLGAMVPFESAIFSSPEGRSFNVGVPMPFRNGMRIVLTNESAEDVRVYYDVNYTLGDRHPAGALYFHAHFRRENPTTMQRDYEILPHIRGKGRYLGANVGVIVDGKRYGETWWGEGEVKIFLDGDAQLPTLSGTGTEDYIGTAYSLGAYSHLYQGAPIADHDKQRYAFYRYHVNDPVYFRREIRVTLQQIGFIWSNDGTPEKPVSPPIYAAGEGLRELDLKRLPQVNLFERTDDYSSCVYFYLDRAENGLPPLAPAATRIKDL